MIITVTKFEPERRWEAPEAGVYTGYAPGKAAKTVTLSRGSGALTDGIVDIDTVPAGWPTGRFIRVTNGAFAGYFLERSKVRLLPAPDLYAAARKEGALAAAQAARSYADSL